MARVASELSIDDCIEITGFDGKSQQGKVTRIQEKSFQLDGKTWYRDNQVHKWKRLEQPENQPYRIDLEQLSKEEVSEACERIRSALDEHNFVVIRLITPLSHPTPEMDQKCLEISSSQRSHGTVLSITWTNHRRDNFTNPTVSIIEGIVTICGYTGEQVELCCTYVPSA